MLHPSWGRSGRDGEKAAEDLDLNHKGNVIYTCSPSPRPHITCPKIINWFRLHSV